MKPSSVTIQMKATEQFFLVVRFIKTYNFESVNEIIPLFQSCLFTFEGLKYGHFQ